EGGEDAEIPREPAGPGARGEHQDLRSEITVPCVDDDGAVPPPELRLSTRAYPDTQPGRGVPDRLHEAERIAVRLVGIEDGPSGAGPSAGSRATADSESSDSKRRP